ncbi:MAG: hypothetical protein HKN20_12425 [Gemmatimonadetes bacterium]|nr:hypothetical protein [Gemmatimonadota bacterium]
MTQHPRIRVSSFVRIHLAAPFPAALLLALLIALAIALVLAPSRASAEPVARGMTVSCQTWGWEWGTDDMVATMADLKAMGCNWIAIHPYAGIRGNGEVVSRMVEQGDTPDWLTRPIEEAHRLGLEMMIKPHLAYWGGPFSWRGEIEFRTDEEWERFFTTYTAWIVELARICKDADAFVIGTELDRTLEHHEQWQRVIAEVRAVTDAPLTYAANWTDYERVSFWPQLDVIGIQSYFPLADTPGLREEASLDSAWASLGDRLRAFAEPLDKRVLLTELGYNRSSSAAWKPWEYRSGGDDAEEIQRRCMNAALRALEGNDLFVGAFLWKWFPGEQQGRRGNFLLSTPTMRGVISSHWVK